MRPGDGASTMMRVERKTASATEWVTKTAVQSLFRSQAQQFLVETIAGHLVERAEGLVEQQQAGPGGKGAGDRYAHLHSARELPRIGARHMGETYELKEGLHFLFADFAGDVLELQPQAYIAGDGSPGKRVAS